ncbi:MAG: NAD(P)H-dependent oxidoreductase, partial [Proteobacteria bacterium]|nr:NAD(P)H-dependent oxidoreductase [Pseudomonadota bacterium]
METPTPILFQCSHRTQGNSNAAVATFLSGIRAEGGEGFVYNLKKQDFKFCRACSMCEKDSKSRCALAGKDYLPDVFADMMQAPFLFFAAPIYFYHLPSRLKTMIDRSQVIYARKMKGDPEIVNLPRRPAYVSLFAGRTEGDKLFDGALLTLKYFLESFNFEIVDPL